MNFDLLNFMFESSFCLLPWTEALLYNFFFLGAFCHFVRMVQLLYIFLKYNFGRSLVDMYLLNIQLTIMSNSMTLEVLLSPVTMGHDNKEIQVSSFVYFLLNSKLLLNRVCLSSMFGNVHMEPCKTTKYYEELYKQRNIRFSTPHTHTESIYILKYLQNNFEFTTGSKAGSQR